MHLSEEGSDHITTCQAEPLAGGKSHIQTFCPHSRPSFLSIYIMQSPKSAAPRPRHVPALLTDDHTPCLLVVTMHPKKDFIAMQLKVFKQNKRQDY